MSGYKEFEEFKNFYVMDEEKLKLANNYVCLQLNNPGVEYKYYYDMYSYITKCFVVLNYKKETQFGEAECNGKIVNFLKDSEHKNCSCASVYFNAVFLFFSSNDSVQYINEIVVCCLKCFEFILTYFSSGEEMFDVFNELDCLYVIEEQFCHNSEIYIGNDQFMTSNENLNNEQTEELYHETKKKLKKFFKKEPERKSCFTSIQKYFYEFFLF